MVNDNSLGARGLKIETRLDGQVMQNASTDNIVFDVASLVAEPATRPRRLDRCIERQP